MRLLICDKLREDIVWFKVEVENWIMKKDVKLYLFSWEFIIYDKFKEDIVKFKVEMLIWDYVKFYVLLVLLRLVFVNIFLRWRSWEFFI